LASSVRQKPATFNSWVVQRLVVSSDIPQQNAVFVKFPCYPDIHNVLHYFNISLPIKNT